MNRRTMALTFALAASLGSVAGLALAQESSSAQGLAFLGAPVTPEQTALGQQVYAANCAACHGAKLEGQPDWKRRLEDGRMPAPPHDASGHTWHHADRQLFTITKLGIGAIVPGYESVMPVYQDILTDDEIAAALAWIKSTWPARQRSFQAEVTANDGSGS